MLVASATLEPPYFCTTSPTTDSFPGPTRGTGADSLATAKARLNGRVNKVALSASYGGTVMIRVGTALALAAVLTLTSCTSGDEDAAPSASPTPSAQPSATERELTPRQRAQQLTALAPETFDASYRLKSKGPRPDASVRMRTKGDRFRLDITHGRRTALLSYAPRGVVSCQIVRPKTKKDRPQRSCFLVSRRPAGVPELFDPEVQRLFRSTQRALTLKGADVTVKQAGAWKAPGKLGPAECFAIKGKDADRGKYCYLSRPGPTIGLLAKAVFPSGTLEIRDVNQVHRQGVFQPPVRPTPLPNN